MKPATYGFRWLLVLIFTAAVCCSAILIYTTGYEPHNFVADVLTTSASLTLSIWIGILTMHHFPTKAGLFYFSIGFGIALGMLSYYADNLVLYRLYEQQHFLEWYRKSQWTRGMLFCICNVWATTLAAQRRKNKILETQFKELSDASTLHREAELFKLRQQLQPHFLYNSLNSINALVLLAPEQAQEMIGKLSEFLRSSVKKETEESIFLKEELEYIESYLSIEMIRFGERLEVVYEKEFEEVNATIPSFLLQPVLENAIKFGLYGSLKKVVITISISMYANMLNVRIANPFDPDNKPLKGTGFGLEGISRRLYLLFGRNDLLTTSKTENQFITSIKIPQKNAPRNPD